MRRTIRWQAEHLSRDHRVADERLQDPYDYEAKDTLVELSRVFAKQCDAVQYRTEPGWTIAYYGSLANRAERTTGFTAATPAGQRT